MKRKWIIAAAALLSCAAITGGSVRADALTTEETKEPACKSAYVCDYGTGTAVYEKNETEHLPIASMCKVMTLLLSFEAVDRGELSYDELVPVSKNAAGMGGSQVFLEAGLEYKAEELMKTVAVCSANDSCVALAERIAGSEEAFISRMNERAKELGAENTLFSNCTGLPRDPQYSCAKDVSLMLREMLKHEKYFEFSRIWTEDFAHPDGRTTLITNTNKLVRSYDGCDGGKTGFTNEAGFCLAATAKRDKTRLVCVVIGEKDSKQRFKDVEMLFDDAFARYESREILPCEPLQQRAAVRGSSQKEVEIVPEHALNVFSERGAEESYTLDLQLRNDLKAPISKGEEVGYAAIYCNGVEIGRTRLLAGQDAPKYTYWEALRESARNWI